MQNLDATLTLALPVHAAQLGVHLQVYLDTLPALNTIRACNRFGKGPRCHINKLPVELVQSIVHYHIMSIRKESLETWMSELRCYEGTCNLSDHHSREELFEVHEELVSERSCRCADRENPSDDNLVDCTGACEGTYEIHESNRSDWKGQVESMTKHRALLQKHFGLDMWLSTACLGPSEEFYCEKETTIAYLSLPGREERSEK